MDTNNVSQDSSGSSGQITEPFKSHLKDRYRKEKQTDGQQTAQGQQTNIPQGQ